MAQQLLVPPTKVAALETTEIALEVYGANKGSLILINPPKLPQGVFFAGARVTGSAGQGGRPNVVVTLVNLNDVETLVSVKGWLYSVL